MTPRQKTHERLIAGATIKSRKHVFNSYQWLDTSRQPESSIYPSPAGSLGPCPHTLVRYRGKTRVNHCLYHFFNVGNRETHGKAKLKVSQLTDSFELFVLDSWGTTSAWAVVGKLWWLTHYDIAMTAIRQLYDWQLYRKSPLNIAPFHHSILTLVPSIAKASTSHAGVLSQSPEPIWHLEKTSILS